jgi:hypothetical protein
MSVEDAGIAATADAAGTHNDQPLLRQRSVGSNWEGILALHLQILACFGLMQACEVCECTPCRSPGFCRACREADERKARREQPSHRPTHVPPDWVFMSLDALWQRFNERRPTPQSTIEAIMYCVRERGVAALKEATNIERLARCDAAARAEINRRIARLIAAKEIAA